MKFYIMIGQIGTNLHFLGLFEGAIFNNPTAFLTLMILLTAVIGFLSGYASIGAFSGMTIFTYIAINVDLWIFNSLLYVILAIVFILMAQQSWAFANGGEM